MDGFANLPRTDFCAVLVTIVQRLNNGAEQAFDLLLAMARLIIHLSGVFVIADLLKATDGKKVFYSHRRIDRWERAFGCLKFRLMMKNGDEVLAAHLAAHPKSQLERHETNKLRNRPCIISINRVLHRESLTEVPRLFNVIKGNMSLIGPRPIVAEVLQMCEVHSHRYFRARPGLTGLWQFSGRSELSYETRFDLNCYYVGRFRLQENLSIIIHTISAVCLAEGIC